MEINGEGKGEDKEVEVLGSPDGEARRSCGHWDRDELLARARLMQEAAMGFAGGGVRARPGRGGPAMVSHSCRSWR